MCLGRVGGIPFTGEASRYTEIFTVHPTLDYVVKFDRPFRFSPVFGAAARLNSRPPSVLRMRGQGDAVCLTVP